MYTLRWLCVFSFLLILAEPVFARPRASSYCAQGGQVVVTGAERSSTKIQQSYPQCSIQVFYTGGASGFVTTNGTSVTYSSGIPFNANSGWAGLEITIAGTPLTVQSVTSPFALVLTSSAGVQASPVAYSMPATAPAAIYSDNAGTPLANPFTSTDTGYWAFYADNGTYDVSANGGGIPAPVTWGAISVLDPISVPLLVSSRTYQASGLNFYQACADAVRRGFTLAIDVNWLVSTSGTCASPIQGLGGSVRPANSQIVTITGAVSCSYGQPCFDTSAAGAGSIFLPGISTPLSATGFGAVCDGVNDDTLAIQSTLQSLPPAGLNPQSLPLYTGAVKIPGQKVATGIGCVISSTINISTYVTMAGVNPESTRITAAPNFNNSAGSETFAFSTTSLEGTGGNPNGDFGSIFRDFQLNTINTGNTLVSCFNWPVSLHSVMDNVSCGTSNRAFVIGGALQTVASADNVTMRNVEADVAYVPGGPCPQGYVFPFFASNGSTNAINVDNWKVQGLARGNGGGFTYPCAEVPLVYIGNGDAGITMNNGNCESCPSFLTIGPGSGNIHINGVAVGGACGANFTAMNRIALVDPDDTGIYINGYSICMPIGIVLGHIPQLSTSYPHDYEIVDPNNNVQKVTTSGTSGATQLTRTQWQTSGTTTWGGAVFTYQSPIASTCKGLILQINCQAEPAASSSSDSNYHFFDFKLGVVDHFGGDIFYGTNAFYGPLTWYPLTPSSNPGFMSINPDAKSIVGNLGVTALSTACQTGLLLGASSLSSPQIALYQDICAGGSPYFYFVMQQVPGGIATGYPVDFKQSVLVEGGIKATVIPSSAGLFGLYLCIDANGVMYKKSSCP